METAIEIKTSVTSIEGEGNDKPDDHANDVHGDHHDNDEEQEPIVLHDDGQHEDKDIAHSNKGFDDKDDRVDEEDNKSTKEDDTDEEENEGEIGQNGTEKGDKGPTPYSDNDSSPNSANVITTQPNSSIKDPGKSTALSDIDVDIEGNSKLEYELAIVPGACLSASAGVGSASKDLCGGFTNLECRYPNVGCEMSCGCDDGLQLVSDCTMELCSANCIFGCLAFSLGLALDTKATWNQDGVEFEVLGTGIETSQGKVLRVLGSGIGIIDSEKRETMKMKKKAKEARKAQNNAAKEKEKRTELEMSGQDNTAAKIEN